MPEAYDGPRVVGMDLHRRREPGQRYEFRFLPAARRTIAQRLPEAVAAVGFEFCNAARDGQPAPV